MRRRIMASMALMTLVLVVAAGIGVHMYVGAATNATLQRTLHSRMVRVQLALSHNLLTLAAPGSSVQPVEDQAVVQVMMRSGVLLYTTATAGVHPLLRPATLRGLKGQRYAQVSVAREKNPLLVLAEPVSDRPSLIALVGTSTDQVHDSLALIDRLLWGAGALALVLSVAGAGLAAAFALRPVDQMRRQAARLSGSGSQARLIEPRTRDELAMLAATLNEFLAKLEEASEVQRRFIASASHELRTPLAGMRTELEVRSPARDPSDEALLQRLDRRVAHLVALTEGLLAIAEGQRGALQLELARSELEPIVSDALSALTPLAHSCGVVLVLDVEGDGICLIDRVRMAQVVENLVVNAINHAPPQSMVDVSISCDDLHVILTVRDRGSGLSPAVASRVFQPFIRGAGEHRVRPVGSGLGLSVVELIVGAHAGTVTLENHPAGGALAQVRLPVFSGTQVEPPVQVVNEGDAGSNPSEGEVMRAMSVSEVPERW